MMDPGRAGITSGVLRKNWAMMIVVRYRSINVGIILIHLSRFVASKTSYHIILNGAPSQSHHVSTAVRVTVRSWQDLTSYKTLMSRTTVDQCGNKRLDCYFSATLANYG